MFPFFIFDCLFLSVYKYFVFLYVYLLTCLIVHLPDCLPACLLACLPTCLPACLSACLPVYLPACLSSFLPIYLHTHLPTCQPAYPSTCLPICLPTCLPVCQQVYVSEFRLSTVNVQHLLEELEALSLGGYVPHLIEAAHVSPAQDDHSQNAEEHEHRLNDVSVHHGLYAALCKGMREDG